MRLNEGKRLQIISNALGSAFAVRHAQLRHEEGVLALEVRRSLLGAHLETIESLPEGWLPRRASIGVEIRTEQLETELRFPSGSERMPADAFDDVQLPGVNELQDGLSIRVLRWADAVEELDLEEKAARRALKNFLAGFSTVSSLAKGWPDGAPFYKHLLSDVSATYEVAVRAVEVNKILGIAPKIEELA